MKQETKRLFNNVISELNMATMILNMKLEPDFSQNSYAKSCPEVQQWFVYTYTYTYDEQLILYDYLTKNIPLFYIKKIRRKLRCLNITTMSSS